MKKVTSLSDMLRTEKKYHFLAYFKEKSYICRKTIKDMRKVLNISIKKIKTNDGLTLARRVTTILMPNGKLRHPVDYFDPDPKIKKVSTEELDNIRIKAYKPLI